jgi:hypothetical protein
MREYDVVRIARLTNNERYYDGTESVKRSPQIGDIGTIVQVVGDNYIVENVNGEGLTVWLADFASAELELI